MALTGYASQALLNLVAGSENAPSATYARYLALFTTAPGDNDSGAVEVSGGDYARVQVAGSVATSAATSSGSTLTFTSVPAWIAAGMLVRDATAPNVIAANTTVVSKTSTTVTLSNAVTGAGVGSGDTITFSAFDAATGAGPATATTGATISYAQSTANWGNVNSWGIYDALTGGNLWDWDWLGSDPWYPCSITQASPGVITAPGITAGSTPNLANGSSVVFTARFGGSLASGLSSETAYTVAGLASDSFNVGTNTTSPGSAMVRQVTVQSIPANITASFAAGALVLTAA